ncbi:phosphoribosyltransferase family protein [Sphaerisporangium sp. NPDC051017]|uniref:phosphoribosyltransferase n=1 Tax=Sphaerisporangium sp. NPDC051017 TaxID=3154636 RepID=UPI003435E3AB
MDGSVHLLTWEAVGQLGRTLASAVRSEGLPQVIVGIARGGLIPAVMIAHHLGVRDVRGISLAHTVTDEVAAVKSPEVFVGDHRHLGDLSGQDVLVVDDIAGSGDTLNAMGVLLATMRPARIRTAVLWLNLANWQPRNADPTYVGEHDQGWVVFPWEKNTALHATPDATPDAMAGPDHSQARADGTRQAGARLIPSVGGPE